MTLDPFLACAATRYSRRGIGVLTCVLLARLEEEESARQKLQLEKVSCDAKLKKLEEDVVGLEDSNSKLGKEKKSLDEKLQEVQQSLQDEEDKCKQLTKQKTKQDAYTQDLEDRLKKEEAVSTFCNFLYKVL